MEALSNEYPSYIDNVYLTDNGESGGGVLEGEWSNFPESLSTIGTIDHAANGHEHLQISPLHHKQPANVILEFSDVDRDLAERINDAAKNKEAVVGIIRHCGVRPGAVRD